MIFGTLAGIDVLINIVAIRKQLIQFGNNMSKYINAEKLIAEIERFNSIVPYENNDRHDEGLHDAYKAVKNIIDSLQQKQPEVDVDLEKEIETWIPKHVRSGAGEWKECRDAVIECGGIVARHFYDLGLNARKEN